jgi:hypothetical protein
MKKVIMTLAVLSTLVGSLAFADVILPNQMRLDNADSVILNEKIVKILGVKAEEFRGANVVNADAKITCSDYGNGQVSCKIGLVGWNGQNR